MNPPKNYTCVKGPSPGRKRYHDSIERESKKRRLSDEEEQEGLDRLEPVDDGIPDFIPLRDSTKDDRSDGGRSTSHKTFIGKTENSKCSPRKRDLSFSSHLKSNSGSTPAQDRLRGLISKKTTPVNRLSSETAREVVKSERLNRPEVVVKSERLNRPEVVVKSERLYRPEVSKTPAQERLLKKLKSKPVEDKSSREKSPTKANYSVRVKIVDEPASVEMKPESEVRVSPVKNLDSDPEDMDWSPIPLPIIDSVVRQSREVELVHASVEPSCGWIETDRFCLVVDTNVLLSSLSLVKETMEVCMNGLQVVVVIPWQVLCELDLIKTLSNTTAARARAASNMLAQLSRRRLPSLWLQPPEYHKQPTEHFAPEVPDDHIILCALQLKKSGCCVSLITFDNNLSVKCEAAGVSTMSEQSFLKLFNKKQPPRVVCLDMPPVDSSPVAQMTYNLCKELNAFLNGFVESGLVRRYGKQWLVHVPSEPPWPLSDALRALRASWDLISSSRFPPSSLTSIENFLATNNYSTVNKQVLTKFATDCCSLASHTLKDSKQQSYLFMSKVMDYLKDTDAFTKISAVTAQFECFRQRIIGFAAAMYRVLGKPWPDHMPSPQEVPEINLQVADKQLEFTVCVLKNVIEGLHMLNRVKGEISESHRCVPLLHSNVCKFLDNKTALVEDYVYFCNSRQVRSTVDLAINQFDQLLLLLSTLGR